MDSAPFTRVTGLRSSRVRGYRNTKITRIITATKVTSVTRVTSVTSVTGFVVLQRLLFKCIKGLTQPICLPREIEDFLPRHRTK